MTDLDKLKKAKIRQVGRSINFLKKLSYTEDEINKLRDDKIWGTIDPTEETNYLNFRTTLETACTTLENNINNSSTIEIANTIDITAELSNLGLTF